MNLTRFIKFACILIIAFQSCRNSKNVEIPPEQLSKSQIVKIDSICQSFIDKGNTAGLSFGLSHNGKTIFSKGYGLANIESKKPATDSTIYAIASISKFITAITTMRIVEAGKLSLSDKIIDHIEGFPQQKYMDEITIEHLLRHQSGLVDHEDWFDSIYINERRVFTNQEFYQFLDQPLFFRPGSQYSYSNSGYAILSSILEKIEQKSFHELIIENINKPLAISSIGMWPERWNSSNAAMGYELTKQGLDTSFHMMTKGMKGDGGLSASVMDLLKIAKGLSTETLLSRPSIDYLLSPTSIGNISIDYGLGVKFGNFGGHKTYGHSGGYKGTGWAILAIYPDTGYAFAAAINTSYSPEEAWMLRHHIMPILLNIAPPAMKSASIKEIEKYTGKYSAFNRWGNDKPSVRIIFEKEGNLFYDNPDTDTPGAQLFQLNDSTFSWKLYPFDEFRFHNVNGEIVACSHYYDGFFGAVRMKKDYQQNAKQQ